MNPSNRFPSGLKGIIVAGSDNNPDPQKLGRVKVFFPQIHGKDFDIEKAPWVQTQSSPNHTGSNSFDRPPQEGSIIHAMNITDSGHCYVTGLINGKFQPTDLATNNNLVNSLPWFARARDITPKFASGPISVSQTTEQNRTGKEKITLGKPNETNAPSIKQRDGTPTTGAFPSLIRKYVETTNIGTALQNAIEGMTNEMAKSLPGSPFSFSNLMKNIPKPLMNQINKNVPKDALNALQNTLNLIGDYTPISGTNFTNNGINVNPDTFYPQVANTLLTLTSIDDIDHIINTIVNSINDITSNNIIRIEIEGPNGNVIQQIFPNGNVIIERSNTEIQNQQFFENFMTSIPSADDQSFLQGSEIINKLIYRMPISEQASLKQSLENKGKNIQKILNDAAKSFFGGGS